MMPKNKNDIPWLRVGALGACIVFICASYMLEPKPAIECGCGTDDVETQFRIDDLPEGVASRRNLKIYIAPGTVGGISETQFGIRIMRSLHELSAFTNADFVRVPSASGAYVKIYPASDEMMWIKKSSYRSGKIVPLGLQDGNWIYLTTRSRWSGASILEAATKHEFGHRLGLGHSARGTSIMNANLSSVTLDASDKSSFQRRLGKPAVVVASDWNGLISDDFGLNTISKFDFRLLCWQLWLGQLFEKLGIVI